MLREAIGVALREAMNSDAVEEFCTGIGLAPPQPPDDIAFTSKRAYVVRRLGGKTQPELVEIALSVLEECDSGAAGASELAELVGRLGASGVPGEMKNLIFAAAGPKPEIVFSDAINNDLMVVKNEQFCLVYDRPLGAGALTWRQLGEWWADREGLTEVPDRDVWSSLYRRLDRSLGDNDAERASCARMPSATANSGPTSRPSFRRSTCTTTRTPEPTTPRALRRWLASAWTSYCCCPTESAS